MSKNTRPLRKHDERRTCGKTRHGAVHDEAPSGSKLLKSFYKAKHGAKASAPKDDKGNVTGTAYGEALAWMKNLRIEPKKHKHPRVPFALR